MLVSSRRFWSVLTQSSEMLLNDDVVLKNIILAELRVYGLTEDARHVASTDPSDGTATRAMVLERAGIEDPSTVAYVFYA